MPFVENPILFETRMEQVAREFIVEDAPAIDTAPSRDYFGFRITKGDEYMIIGSHHVLIENVPDYCEKVLCFDWCTKK
ncbi:hypothetical protein [Lysinibacillus sp. LZ02]|uniref:hypothetical protein n=1 Tax=Lysinibacillus sp. LZ02 TaxID=3420668 RepID=UPI003D3677B2